MKFKFLSLIMMIATIAALASLTSCSTKTEFDELDDKGYTISVKYEAGGEDLKDIGSNVIDVFNPSNYEENSEGKIEITLTDPSVGRVDLSRPLQRIIGWYQHREFKNGKDDTEGYIYSDPWDFESDRLVLDKDGEYTSSENQLVLYAAWVPYFTFNIHIVDENNNVTLSETLQSIYLDVPKWEDGKSTITMGHFSSRDGYTFDKLYLDPDLTALVSESTVSGVVDYDKGILESEVVNLYTTWQQGEHYRIYEPKELRQVPNDGICHIMNDLDFSDTPWPLNYTKFKGTIYGNGHTISNISFKTSYASNSHGMFSELSDGALIKDLRFENVTHTIDVGSVKTGYSFGLFAGKISAGATIENVTITGKILFGTNCNYLSEFSDYDIGAFAGSGTPSGIDTSGVTADLTDSEGFEFTLSRDQDDKITLVFNTQD